jgi:type IV secretion system protein VirD4
VLSENGAPIIAHLDRCIEGKSGKKLLAGQDELRQKVATARGQRVPAEARATAALVEARRRGLSVGGEDIKL